CNSFVEIRAKIGLQQIFNSCLCDCLHTLKACIVQHSCSCSLYPSDLHERKYVFACAKIDSIYKFSENGFEIPPSHSVRKRDHHPCECCSALHQCLYLPATYSKLISDL